MKITCRCYERGFLLTLKGQSYMMVSLESIKKTYLRVPIGYINKLVYLRHWKGILRTCPVQIREVYKYSSLAILLFHYHCIS